MFKICYFGNQPVSDPVISSFTQGTKRVVVCGLGHAGSYCKQARVSLVLAELLFAPSRLLGHGKADPQALCLNCGWVSVGVCPVVALCPQPLRAGVGVMGSVGYPLQHALWAPITAAASAALCFQIFGIFLA